MTSDASTRSDGEIRFTPDFVANIPRYRQAIRAHRAMSWARRCSLDDDLVQLTLIDLARVNRASTPRAPRHPTTSASPCSVRASATAQRA
jgi:hypothetical protein